MTDTLFATGEVLGARSDPIPRRLVSRKPLLCALKSGPPPGSCDPGNLTRIYLGGRCSFVAEPVKSRGSCRRSAQVSAGLAQLPARLSPAA